MTAFVNGKVVGRARVEPYGIAGLRVRTVPDDDGTCRVVFRMATTKVPGARRPPPARRPLPRLRLPAVRIAFDVSPLSHPRTGIGNYVRGSLAGLAEAAAGKHELVAFAPTRLRGRKLIREALDGLPVELRTVVLPWSHAFRMGWSRLGRPSVERFLGRVDVLHFSDWLVPPQRDGIRSTMVHDLVPLLHPEWVTPRTRSMHGYKYARTAECDLVFVNSAYTGRDVEEHLAVPRERIRVAVARRLRRVHRRGRACRGSAGRTCSASPRSSRARTSPRSSRPGGRCAASSRSQSRALPAGATSRSSTTGRSSSSASSRSVRCRG